jgi:hypothetical protein
MHIYHVVLVLIEFERELAAAFVPHDTAYSGGYCTLRKVFQMLGMVGFDETNKEHFPKADLTDGQKVILGKMIGEIHDHSLAL